MKPEAKLVLQFKLKLLHSLLAAQEETIRFYESKVVEAMESKQATYEEIEEIEAKLEAYELVNA